MATRIRSIVALGVALGGLAPTLSTAQAPSGELRLQWEARSASGAGPLAQADRLSPGIATPLRSAWVAQAEWRHVQRLDALASGLSAAANLLAATEKSAGDDRRDASRVNELHVSLDRGNLAATAGRKVVGWDVGHGFRPNDVVQQEVRRTLLGTTPEGRPLLQLEHFDADRAATLVWVNPQHVNASAPSSRGGDESALAARLYQRLGSLDLHGFGRIGRRTGGSLGAALAWVAGEQIEWHASWRALQRHEAWSGPSGAALAAIDPWTVATRGGTQQWLAGFNWTGGQQRGLLVELWRDGTAPSDAEWDAWTTRNRALPAVPAPALARAGNLAWQAAPLTGTGLRRDSLFVRASWQPPHWQFTLDALFHPADRGRIVTAGVQWQGDQLRLSAIWRAYGGPAGAVLAQLPLRGTGVVAASWSF